MNTNEQTRRERNLSEELAFLELQLSCECAAHKDMNDHTVQQINIIEELVDSNLCWNTKQILLTSLLDGIRVYFVDPGAELRRITMDRDSMELFLDERKRLAPKCEMEPSPF